MLSHEPPPPDTRGGGGHASGLPPLVPLSCARELVSTSLAAALGLPLPQSAIEPAPQPRRTASPQEDGQQGMVRVSSGVSPSFSGRGSGRSAEPAPVRPVGPKQLQRQQSTQLIGTGGQQGNGHAAGQASMGGAADMPGVTAQLNHQPAGETSSLGPGKGRGQGLNSASKPANGMPHMAAAAMSDQHPTGSYNSPPATSYLSTGAHPLPHHHPGLHHHPLAYHPHAHPHAPAFSSGGGMHPAFPGPGPYPPYLQYPGFPLMGHTFMGGGPMDFSGGSYSRGGVSGGGTSGLKGGSNGQQSFDGTDGGDDGDGARAIKRPRLVWTPQLHKRFEEAVAKLGDNRAVPKNIMQEMNVEGLTRENVASHLQKYRLQRQAARSDIAATTTTTGGDPAPSTGPMVSAPAVAG